MPYKNKIFIALILNIVLIPLAGVVVFAETPTPYPTSTPWSNGLWPTQNPFMGMCTPTPGASLTPAFSTPPPFAQCPPCDPETGMDTCGYVCWAATQTPGPTALPPTPIPTSTGSKYYSDLVTLQWVIDAYPYREFTTTNGGCTLTTSKLITCAGNWVARSTHGGYPLTYGTIRLISGWKVNPGQGDNCVKSYTTGTMFDVPGNIVFSQYNNSNNGSCANKYDFITYSASWTNQSFQTGRKTDYSNKQGFTMTPQVQSTTDAWGSFNFQITIDQLDPVLTATPTITPTATLNPYCGGGIQVPGGGTDPIVWINPPDVIAGSCYTVVPQLSMGLPDLSAWMPEGWEWPDASIESDGYQVCIDWLNINMSFAGIQFDGLVGVVAWLFVAGLVYKEIAS